MIAQVEDEQLLWHAEATRLRAGALLGPYNMPLLLLLPMSLLEKQKNPHPQGYRGKHIRHLCDTTKGLIHLFIWKGSQTLTILT